MAINFLNIFKTTKAILEDIPDAASVIAAAVKCDFSGFSNMPQGTVQLSYNSTAEKYTVQRGNGSGGWEVIANFAVNADKVGGYAATTVKQANTVAVRDASGKINADLNGNALTANTAQALTTVNPIAMGGTGGSTPEEARDNLDVVYNGDFNALSAVVADAQNRGQVGNSFKNIIGSDNDLNNYSNQNEFLVVDSSASQNSPANSPVVRPFIMRSSRCWGGSNIQEVVTHSISDSEVSTLFLRSKNPATQQWSKWSELVNKAYVDAELAKKAPTSHVDTELAKKASTSYVDAELAKKATLRTHTSFKILTLSEYVNGRDYSGAILFNFTGSADTSGIAEHTNHIRVWGKPMQFDADIRIDGELFDLTQLLTAYKRGQISHVLPYINAKGYETAVQANCMIDTSNDPNMPDLDWYRIIRIGGTEDYWTMLAFHHSGAIYTRYNRGTGASAWVKLATSVDIMPDYDSPISIPTSTAVSTAGWRAPADGYISAANGSLSGNWVSRVLISGKVVGNNLNWIPSGQFFPISAGRYFKSYLTADQLHVIYTFYPLG